MPELELDDEIPGWRPPREFKNIDVAMVIANTMQPRKHYSDESLKSLAESIRIAGVIQPIIVKVLEDRYQLVAGERRLRAVRLLGLTQIPAIVRTIDSVQQAQLALIENIHREDLNPIDRAVAYRAMINSLGFTHQELAMKLGEERSTIANFIRLIDLESTVRDMVAAGILSLGHAKLLASLNDPSQQVRHG